MEYLFRVKNENKNLVVVGPDSLRCKFAISLAVFLSQPHVEMWLSSYIRRELENTRWKCLGRTHKLQRKVSRHQISDGKQYEWIISSILREEEYIKNSISWRKQPNRFFLNKINIILFELSLSLDVFKIIARGMNYMRRLSVKSWE